MKTLICSSVTVHICCNTLVYIALFVRSGLRSIHTHTHTHTQPFYGSLNFFWDNPGEPVPEETFSYSHLLWSSIIPYLLPPSVTIHGILPVQFMCLTVFFHNLQVFSLLGTLHFVFHIFLHPIIVFFLQHMPISSQHILL